MTSRTLAAISALTAALAFPAPASALLIPISGSDTLQLVSGDDAATGAINLGFTFDYFGSSYSTANLSSNGILTFGGGNSSFTNLAFPAAGLPTISPLWDDLFIDPGDTVRSNATTSGVFVATWNGLGTFTSEADSLTFQIVLFGSGNPYGYADGTIAFSYDLVSGLSDDSGTVGLNAGNGVDFATLNALGLGGANGLFTEAQAIALSNNTYFFVPNGSGGYRATDVDPSAVPEPTSMLLLGTGLIGVVRAARRRRTT